MGTVMPLPRFDMMLAVPKPVIAFIATIHVLVAVASAEASELVPSELLMAAAGQGR